MRSVVVEVSLSGEHGRPPRRCATSAAPETGEPERSIPSSPSSRPPREATAPRRGTAAGSSRCRRGSVSIALINSRRRSLPSSASSGLGPGRLGQVHRPTPDSVRAIEPDRLPPFPPPPRLLPVAAGVGEDAREPRLERQVLAVGRDVREDLHERVLHRFIGLCRVPQQVQRQAHRLPLVQRHEVGERVPRLVLLAREHGSLDATGLLGAAGLRTAEPEPPGAARHVTGPVARGPVSTAFLIREPDEPVTVFAPVYATEREICLPPARRPGGESHGTRFPALVVTFCRMAG